MDAGRNSDLTKSAPLYLECSGAFCQGCKSFCKTQHHVHVKGGIEWVGSASRLPTGNFCSGIFPLNCVAGYRDLRQKKDVSIPTSEVELRGGRRLRRRRVEQTTSLCREALQSEMSWARSRGLRDASLAAARRGLVRRYEKSAEKRRREEGRGAPALVAGTSPTSWGALEWSWGTRQRAGSLHPPRRRVSRPVPKAGSPSSGKLFPVLPAPGPTACRWPFCRKCQTIPFLR